MPTVFRKRPYRFFFFSREPNEAPHIQAERDDSYAKFWVNPIGLARNRGFKSHELTELRTIVEENARFFEEKWHEHFRNQGGTIRG